MPTPTYDLIEEKVLGSAQASVTFSSIPGTYKDLVLEWAGGTTATSVDVRMQVNSDSSKLYSTTRVTGNGTAASSGRVVRTDNEGAFWQTYFVAGTTANNMVTWQLMSYANTNVNKTCLIRTSSAGAEVSAIVGLYGSTSAITSLYLFPSGSTTFTSGSVFRLWGVSG